MTRTFDRLNNFRFHVFERMHAFHIACRLFFEHASVLRFLSCSFIDWSLIAIYISVCCAAMLSRGQRIALMSKLNRMPGDIVADWVEKSGTVSQFFYLVVESWLSHWFELVVVVPMHLLYLVVRTSSVGCDDCTMIVTHLLAVMKLKEKQQICM